MNKTISIINKILFYGLFIIGIVFAFLSRRYLVLLMTIFPAIIISWFASRILSAKHLSSDYELPINISLWLNVLGETYFYYPSQYYDKFLHLTVGFLITIIIYEYFSKSSGHKAPKKDLVFFSVLGIFAIWEITEYFLMLSTNYPFVGVLTSDNNILLGPYADTMWDLIMGCLGSLLYIIFKKEGLSKAKRKLIERIRKNRKKTEKR